MVEWESPQMDLVFRALGDSTRRQMLRDLAQGERSISTLAEPFSMTFAAASKHVRVLEKAGLVRREIRWRTHLCHLEAAPLKQALSELTFYERFWAERLDALESLLREEDAQSAPASPVPQPEKGDGQ
jgi:DNA-binding transcriptional ArsR family regulator